MKHTRRTVPGFRFTIGWSLFYLSLIVLIPLATIPLKASELGWSGFWAAAVSPRAVAAYRLSIGASFIAAVVNVFFGLLVAWVLVRYPLPGKRLIDGLVDLPFALPTAVAGISLTTLYSKNGWIGRLLEPFGIHVAYTWVGIVVVLTFIGLPFVVRTVQPVLQNFDQAIEEAAASLGAGRWQIIRRVILPEMMPALVTGFALSFARALGEYGSVIFIAGNMPMKSEITPLLIMIKLEQFDYAGAAAIALVFLLLSFAMLLVINVLQARRHPVGQGDRAW